LMAESEDLELKHRTAPEGSENSGRESRQKMPARESKGSGNSQCINQIGVCENHSRFLGLY
jgi:hypothetical protein